MKAVSVLALASGAVATFGGFHNAPPFSCPGNTDNKCTDKQLPGFDWNDAPTGPFDKYDDFDFKGWECKAGSGRRDRFDARTFGGKSIYGSCGQDKHSSPSFGCGSRGKTDKFSLGGIHVIPEFDCDLDFHYDMPDGSLCKHRSKCSTKGTWVKNNQCGGAKNVTIIYPPQPNKPKKTCGIHVPSMTFDCSTKTKTTKTKPTKPATKPPVTHTKPATTEAKPTTEVDTETCTDEESTTTRRTRTKPVQTTPGTTVSGTKPVQTQPGETTAVESKPVESTTAESKPVQSTTAVESKPVESSPVESKPVGSTPAESKPVESTPAESKPVESTPVQTTPVESVITTVTTTTFDSTSTIFTTSIQTITSCAETVTDCPGDKVKTTVVTVALSTTICPVTETHTITKSKPVETKPVETKPGQSKPVETKPGETKTSNSPVSSSAPQESLPATQTKPAGPEETLPVGCPEVVPKCLNTFLFQLSCQDNTDHACYCPDKLFVENIFSCLYAHGESDAIVSQAVVYFQGLCAPYVPKNPAIATGATVTTYITVTAAPTGPAVPQTTVVVDQTTVVPCTDEAGKEIPSSSTTVTISTILTVPKVDFTTTEGTAAIVPVPTQPSPVETGKVSPPPVAAPTTKAPAVGPTGTGGIIPTATPTGELVPVAAAGRTGAGFGFAGLAVMVAAALL